MNETELSDALGRVDPVRRMHCVLDHESLDELFEEIAATPRLRPAKRNQLPSRRSARPTWRPTVVPGRRRRVLATAAAFVLIAGVGAAMSMIGARNNEVRPAAEPAATTGLGGAPGPSPGGDASAPVGLFPAGGIDAVLAAAYDSPEAVVQAYLDDRVDPARVPFGTVFTATVHDSRMVDEDRAIVYFGLQAPNDGSDGHAEVVTVVGPDGTVAWVVTQAFVVSLEIPAMSYRAGELTGASSGGPYGTNLYVRDPLTDELLNQARFPLLPPDSFDRPPGTPIDVTGLTAPSVAVQVWLTGFDAGVAAPVFGEFLLRDGDETVTGSRVITVDYYPDFPMVENATVSALDALEETQSIVIIDNDDVTITASHDVTGGTYCVEVLQGSNHSRDCWPLSSIAAGDAREYVGRVLYRIVPDGVTVTQDGVVVPVTDNVWYALSDVEGGSIPRYEFTHANGTQIEGDQASPPPPG